MKRDTQRSKVYSSEDKVFKRTYDIPSCFTNINECIDYVREIQQCEYWVANKGYKRINVKRKRKNSGGSWYYSEKTIRLSPWAMRRWVIIHEMAHALTSKMSGRRDVPGHGSTFCRNYIELTRCMLGEKRADNLEWRFKEDGILVKPR